MNTTTHISTPSRLRRAGLTRTVAAAAVAASTALVTANAGIIYSGVVNTSQSAPTSGVFGIPVNLDNLGPAEFTLYAEADFSKGGDAHAAYIRTFGGGFKPLGNSTTGAEIIKLSLGQPVSSSSVFTTASSNGGIARFLSTSVSSSNWAEGDTAYMGFTFNPTGSTPLYGWAEIALSAGPHKVTLVDYAYEDGGFAILTGAGRVSAVPEPATTFFGLACLAALGLRRRNRRSEMPSPAA